MATKKIVYVITKGVLGGAQHYVFDLASSLPRDIYEPVVVVGGEGTWLTEACTAVGVRVVTLPHLGRDISFFKEFLVLRSLVMLFKKERPDVAHLNSSKIGILGAVAARIAGVRRVIFTSHGWAFNEKRSPLGKIAFWIAHAVSMMLVDVTIANSRATATSAPLKWKLKTVRLSIKPIDYLERGAAREMLKLPDGFLTGTIAELHTNKGIDMLIDALQDTPDTVSSVVIGGGEKRAVLNDRAETRGVKRRITFLGHIDNAAHYLKAFDIFVLPSRTESLGYVLLEAGLAGLPVVATRVGGIPEIIEDGVTGLLIPPEDPEALAGAISKLAADPTYAQKLATALKSKVEKEFSFEKMVRQTVAIY